MDDTRRHDGTRSTLAAAVVASNELLRHGLAGLLRLVAEIGPVHEVSDLAGLSLLGKAATLDLVVVAGVDAGWLASADAKTGGQILVVVDPVTVSRITSEVSRLADGFLWQPTLNAESMWQAVQRLYGGEAPVPPELTKHLLARVDDGDVRRPRPGTVNLTDREREALALLVKGLSNKQIAKRLSISSHGAKRLVTSIMLKLDAPNRTVAAVTAVRAGLVHDPT